MANFCMECGAKLSPEDKFCPSCGQKVVAEHAEAENQIQSNAQSVNGLQTNLGAKLNQISDTVAPAARSIGDNVSQVCTVAVDAVEKKYDETRQKINDSCFEPPKRRDFCKMLLLSGVTLGIYSLYWHYMFVKDLKKIAGEDSIREYIPALLLGIVTLGIYMIYYQYKMGDVINYAQDMRGMSGERRNFAKLMIFVIVVSMFSSIILPLLGAAVMSLYYYKTMIDEYNKVIEFDNRSI